MNIGDKFSFSDFLAYFFPGTLNLSGIYVLCLLTPFGNTVKLPQADLTTLVVFITFGYIFGILFAGISGRIIRFIEKLQRYKNPRNEIPLPQFKDEIVNAFSKVFDMDKKQVANWSSNNFFLCRTYVIEFMPNMAQVINRQNGILQLRTNLVFPIILWTINGITWGLQTRLSSPTSGLTLIVLSAVFGVILFTSNLDRKKDNHRREVRETISAFLSGYNSRKFRRTED